MNATKNAAKEKLTLDTTTGTYVLFLDMLEVSALDNVAQPLRHQGVSPREAKQRAGELLIDLGLESRMHGLPAMLSGGEQQRVAIARALVSGPDLLFADEPTGELDSATGATISTLLRNVSEELGVTVFRRVEEAIEWADVLMVEYHREDRSHEPVIREAHERGIGVVVKKGLASGRLPPAESIRFVLGQPGVSSLIIGSLDAGHLAENVAAAG